jgi:hypothetical protein
MGPDEKGAGISTLLQPVRVHEPSGLIVRAIFDRLKETSVFTHGRNSLAQAGVYRAAPMADKALGGEQRRNG